LIEAAPHEPVGAQIFPLPAHARCDGAIVVPTDGRGMPFSLEHVGRLAADSCGSGHDPVFFSFVVPARSEVEVVFATEMPYPSLVARSSCDGACETIDARRREDGSIATTLSNTSDAPATRFVSIGDALGGTPVYGVVTAQAR
jgi:hypothetical protein